MSEATFLVDYDNVRANRTEYAAQDVEANLASIVESIVVVTHACLSVPAEIRLRLYGGWIDQEGHFSRRAQWVLSSVKRTRGLFRGVRVLPEVAISLARHFTVPLAGLVRTDRARPEQKMVDTLMAVDAMTLSAESELFIVTDDDDLVPAAIGISALGRSAHLVRRRRLGWGINDERCTRAGVVFAILP